MQRYLGTNYFVRSGIFYSNSTYLLGFLRRFRPPHWIPPCSRNQRHPYTSNLWRVALERHPAAQKQLASLPRDPFLRPESLVVWICRLVKLARHGRLEVHPCGYCIRPRWHLGCHHIVHVNPDPGFRHSTFSGTPAAKVDMCRLPTTDSLP